MQAPASPPPVLVEDHREHRIRKPADLLRCLACIVGVVIAFNILGERLFEQAQVVRR